MMKIANLNCIMMFWENYKWQVCQTHAEETFPWY